MKITQINQTDYFIYLFDKQYSLDSMEKELASILEILKRRISFNGFYQIDVFLTKIGLFLKIVFLKKAFYPDTFNWQYKIGNLSIDYKTKEYSVIKDYKYQYCEGYFVVPIEEIDSVLSLVEYGDFVLRGVSNE